jgi:hypothetical protein
MFNFKTDIKSSQDAISFGRWILKHTVEISTLDGFECWKYKGNYYDTHELYHEYKNNPI